MANQRIADYVARLERTVSHGQTLLPIGNRRVAGRFYRCTLASVFQAVHGPATDIVGHAAYIRCIGGADGETQGGLSPWQLFALASGDEDLVRLDRLCRTVHAINYFIDAPPQRLLFLGVQERLLAAVPDDHGRTFADVLRGLGVPTRDVVIEIPAAANRDAALLARVVANYRSHGYRVALTHNRNAPGLLLALDHLRPDIVKLRYQGNDRILKAAVLEVQATGARALITHLESGEQLDAARAAGADLLQGFAFGRTLPEAYQPAPASIAAVAP
jgi:EAL domain-containing protein (putative c-di-GMP-specific phosphodiesterase class I)